MPKDKTLSHERVIEAAKQEFLEKGFIGASMRTIGEKAGMTQAGLYRHFKNKEDMFEALVKPAEDALCYWYRKHSQEKFDQIERDLTKNELFEGNFVDALKELLYKYEDEFKLILLCSRGTKYEHFVEHIVEVEQKGTLEALKYLKASGKDVNVISEESMHFLMSAYVTALLEPFVHGMNKEEAIKNLDILEAFFMPGWQKIMGY